MDSQRNLTDLENELFKRRDILGKNYRENADTSLLDFSKKQLGMIRDYSSSVPDDRRQDLIEVISGHVEKILGEEARDRVRNQLLKYFYVITADHHGPLTDPGFLNNNLLTAIAS